MLTTKKPRILGVAVHAIDKFAGLPLWKYSMPFASLKAYLSKFPEYEQVIFEMKDYYQNESLDDISSFVLSYQPEMILFSVYVWNFQIYKALAHKIKSTDPNVLIVLGGPEVSDDTKNLLTNNKEFDIIVSGEGEHTFYEIVRHWLKGNCFSNVAGITYRQEQQVIVNQPEDASILFNVNVIPSPFRDDIIDTSKIKGSFAAIETQRGCNFSCGFCRYRKIGQGARFFELDRVFKDLDFLKKAGIKDLYIMDPTFNNKPERAKTILRYIIDSNMNVVINAEMVPEFFEEEMLSLALQAGIVNIEVGVQSIHKKTLKIMQRPRSARKLDAKITMASGIRVNKKKFNVIPQIIYGLPGEIFSDYCQSFDYLYQLDLEEIAMYHLLVLRDTQYYRDKDTHGFVYEAAPPHRLLSSKDWPAKDLLLAGKLSTAAISSQFSLRRNIQQFCYKHNISPSAFFLELVQVEKFPNTLAYAFPIYGSVDAKVCSQVLEKIGKVLLTDGEDEVLQKTIRRNKLMFSARAFVVEKKKGKTQLKEPDDSSASLPNQNKREHVNA